MNGPQRFIGMHRHVPTAALAAILSLAWLAGPVEAQLASPDAAALGMGDTRTAQAGGFTAISTNPAALAMPGGPATSGTLLTLQGEAGLGPIGLGDLADFEGRSVPDEVRQRWLDRIVRSGEEEGSAAGQVTFFAAQVGRFGVQLSTTAEVLASLSPGAAELVLFGNAGRTGQPEDIDVAGSDLDLGLISTFAVSYGHPVMRTPDRDVAVGATLKYTMAHAMMTATALGGGATASPLELDVAFPIVQSDSSVGFGSGNRSSGVGMDLGVGWREGPWVMGLAVQNVFHTFSWDDSDLLLRPGEIRVVEGEWETDFDLRPFDDVAAALRGRVDDQEYSPAVAAGVAHQLRPDLRLTGELRHRFGSERRAEPATHAGLGAEYRPVTWLPLRAGGGVLSGGYLLSAGVGVHLLPFRVDAAVARRSGELGSANLLMVSASLWN